MNTGMFQAIGFLMMVAFVAYLGFRQLRKKRPNAEVWLHPDHGGGIDYRTVTEKSPLMPWKLEWDWFGLAKRDIWLWYEDRIDETLPPPSAPQIPTENQDGWLVCQCGYKQPGDKRKLMDLHLQYRPNKGDQAQFERDHRLVAAADYRKEAIQRIVEAQNGPLIKTSYVLKPYEPKPIKLVSPQEAGERAPHQRPKLAINTPNSLWDTTNWQCAVRFGTVKNKVAEAVKLGVGLGMFAICIVALIMIIDMVQKGQKL